MFTDGIMLYIWYSMVLLNKVVYSLGNVYLGNDNINYLGLTSFLSVNIFVYHCKQKTTWSKLIDYNFIII